MDAGALAARAGSRVPPTSSGRGKSPQSAGRLMRPMAAEPMARAGWRIGPAGAWLFPGRARSRASSSSWSDRERIALSGVLIDRVDLAESADRIAAYLSSPRLHQI